MSKSLERQPLNNRYAFRFLVHHVLDCSIPHLYNLYCRSIHMYPIFSYKSSAYCTASSVSHSIFFNASRWCQPNVPRPIARYFWLVNCVCLIGNVLISITLSSIRTWILINRCSTSSGTARPRLIELKLQTT